MRERSMYAKIASTQFEDVNAFVAWAIKGMEKSAWQDRKKRSLLVKRQDGRDYFINEYPATKTYSQWERVGYVQLPHAVAYIVLYIARSSELPQRFRRASRKF